MIYQSSKESRNMLGLQLRASNLPDSVQQLPEGTANMWTIGVTAWCRIWLWSPE